MAKTYPMRFGFGDPRNYTGLAPTFLIFKDNSGANVTPPSISEIGSGTGIYAFSYGTTTPIVFLADAATTSPGQSGRYVVGSIDPADRADEYGNTLVAMGSTQSAVGNTLVAIGNTSIAISNTLIAVSQTLTILATGLGSTASSFGDSSTDPVDIFGYMKRIVENLEGNQTYIKPTGALTIYSRGSSVTLREKTITNSVTTVIKT